ncbi:hypothetical protein KFK09_007272 [Dendrobium nobile]|uniref:Uncharacterized protein n=1 Tax=Dendrobium nobile TaxID=94219 RepID=A0A8T3BW00_DENNO|nr:hypothetical protein KFK09_007272 [Dendrobium nobile]
MHKTSPDRKKEDTGPSSTFPFEEMGAAAPRSYFCDDEWLLMEVDRGFLRQSGGVWFEG